MNDGSWMSVDDEDGATIAVLCSRDETGTETLLSECGRRLLRRGSSSFVDADNGRQYRERSGAAPAREPPAEYEILVGDLPSYTELDVRGDFRHSSAVDVAWTRALARVSANGTGRVLVVRGTGRVASDTEKLDLLRRFLAGMRGDERVAIVLAGAGGSGGATLVALARMHRLQLAVFTDRGEAEHWLAA